MMCIATKGEGSSPGQTCLRLVQDVEQLIEALRAHVEREFAALGSSNSAGVRVKSVGDWWEADPQSKLFQMAERALTREWGCQPLFVREGGTMPVCSATPPLTEPQPEEAHACQVAAVQSA